MWRVGCPDGVSTSARLRSVLAIILPLLRALPAVYVWNVRRRLIHWYRQLNALEKSLDGGAAKYAPVTAQNEIERIDAGVRRIRMPNYFSDQLYDLRGHIDLVRQRLARPASVPAE